MKKSLIKTATFASVHFTVAFSVAYAITGSIGIAGAIALIEPAANTVAYFLHERAWARIEAGPAPADDPAGGWAAPLAPASIRPLGAA